MVLVVPDPPKPCLRIYTSRERKEALRWFSVCSRERNGRGFHVSWSEGRWWEMISSRAGRGPRFIRRVVIIITPWTYRNRSSSSSFPPLCCLIWLTWALRCVFDDSGGGRHIAILGPTVLAIQLRHVSGRKEPERRRRRNIRRRRRKWLSSDETNVYLDDRKSRSVTSPSYPPNLAFLFLVQRNYAFK